MCGLNWVPERRGGAGGILGSGSSEGSGQVTESTENLSVAVPGVQSPVVRTLFTSGLAKGLLSGVLLLQPTQGQGNVGGGEAAWDTPAGARRASLVTSFLPKPVGPSVCREGGRMTDYLEALRRHGDV